MRLGIRLQLLLALGSLLVLAFVPLFVAVASLTRASMSSAREASALGVSGRQFEIAGASLAAIGGIGVVVGATLLAIDVTRGKRDDKPPATTLIPGGWIRENGGGVWLHGSF